MTYAVVYPLAWIAISFFWGQRAFHRFVSGGIGKS
jgi:hypothetical protein